MSAFFLKFMFIFIYINLKKNAFGKMKNLQLPRLFGHRMQVSKGLESNELRNFLWDTREALESSHILDERISYSVENNAKCSNLVDSIKSDIALDYEKRKLLLPSENFGSGYTEVRFFFCRGFDFDQWRSGEQSNSQQEPPVFAIEMPHSRIEQIQEDEETYDAEHTGLWGWLISTLFLSPRSHYPTIQQLRERVENQQQFIQQQQLQLNSHVEQLEKINKHLKDQLRRVLDVDSRCRRIEDYLQHPRNDPPPPPPPTGNGSIMT